MSAALFGLLLVAAPFTVDGADATAWTARQLWEKSDEYFHQGKYPEAVRLHERIMELDPGDLEAYAVAAWLTWSMGDEPRARGYLQREVKANPETWESYWELGFHLLDRCGDPVAALPVLAQVLNYPPYPDRAARTLAHAYRWAEQPTLAVALWDRLAAEGNTPGAILGINRDLALRDALSSDMFARDAGVLSGPLDPVTLPRVLRDERTDPDGDGFADHRVLELDDPADLDGEPDYRIVYQGQLVIKLVRWSWTEMCADLNDDGSFDDETPVCDEDGDGFAESLPPLLTLGLQRQRLSPTARRFASPDRYELGVAAHGGPVPLYPRVRDGQLRLEPRFVIASDLPVEFAVGARQAMGREFAWLASAPLAAGVYHDSAGPGAPPLGLSVDPSPLGEGRFWLVTALKVNGVVVDLKVEPDLLLEVGPEGLRLLPPTAAESVYRDAPPEEPAPANPGQPGHEG